MPALKLPQTVLLDGGMGRELRFRGVDILDTIWSANALLVAPEIVRQIHLDFISAGADIITTNTYGLVRADLAKEGIEKRFVELNKLACTLALDAREAAGRSIMIAGSLPPLRGSYRPDLVGDFEEIEPLYREQADGLLELRPDLDPESYAEHVAGWLIKGATVVGGCCGTRPAHIARLRQLVVGH